MERHIEPRVILLAAEKIRQEGTLMDGKHVHQQISLEISFDGYTITISDLNVSLSLFFHNKIKVESKHTRDIDVFYSKLCRLAKHHVS